MEIAILISCYQDNRRSLNGTAIDTRNCLIRNGSQNGFSLSLKKDRYIIIGGTVVTKSKSTTNVVGENTKSFRVQRRYLKCVSIDVKPSADSREKQAQQKEGKYCQLSLEYG